MLRLLVLCVVLFAMPLCAATFDVTNLNDSGAGSLRQAILDHQSAGGTNTIDFTVSGTVTLASNLPTFNTGSLAVNGHSSGSTIDGAGSFRAFAADNALALTLNGLTITNCSNFFGPGVYFPSNGSLTLTLNDCVFTGSASPAGTATVFVQHDVSGTATVSINRCTFSGGTHGAIILSTTVGSAVTIADTTISGYTSTPLGGGMQMSGGTGSATLTNCTISGNSATRGGGIYLDSGTSATLINCTVAGNTASGSSGYGGGGILLEDNTASLTLQNTIVAGNTAPNGPDIHLFGGGSVTSNDGNLIGNNSGMTMSAQTNDQVGTSGSPIDPMLDTLANNGGPTQTRALQTGSPAINNGVSGGPSLDQRGITRDANPDIGAYEYIGTPQLQVTYNSTTQTSGASNALTPDVQEGTGVPVTINLANVAAAGAGDLTVTLPLTVSGLTNCTASVTTPPSATIAAGANSDLVLTITPSGVGAYSATLTVVNSDSANSPFVLTFTGNATMATGGGSGGGGDDDESCSTGEGSGCAWLALLGVIAIIGVRLRRRLVKFK